MSDSSSSTPSAPRYTPPPELVAAAEAMLRDAYPEELALASRAYTAYGVPTGGRSGITGDKLPVLDACPLLPRAGWLAVVRLFTEVYGKARSVTVDMSGEQERTEPLHVDVSTLKPELERLEGMIHQLTTAPVSMSDLCHGARALAEASAFLNTSDSDASKAVSELVQDLAKCLSAQVRELTPPSHS